MAPTRRPTVVIIIQNFSTFNSIVQPTGPLGVTAAERHNVHVTKIHYTNHSEQI